MPSARMRRNCCIRQLAMLQREAVVGIGMLAQCAFERIEHEFGRLVSIGMTMHHHVCRERPLENVAQLLRRDVPEPVRGSVVVPRPMQARRESLDRTIDEKFDRAEPQSVRTPLGKRDTTVDGAAASISRNTRSGTIRAGKVGSPVTFSIISTAGSGKKFARSAAVVTPILTQSRANARIPGSSAARIDRSNPACLPTGVIASAPSSRPSAIRPCRAARQDD